jgi:hypothetical protein
MGRIANISDLPLDQKILIVATYFSVEFLSQLAIEQGKTFETVSEQNLEYVKQRFENEFTEAKVNAFLKEIFDRDDSVNF